LHSVNVGNVTPFVLTYIFVDCVTSRVRFSPKLCSFLVRASGIKALQSYIKSLAKIQWSEKQHFWCCFEWARQKSARSFRA